MKRIGILFPVFLCFTYSAMAQDSTKVKSLEIYGFAMTDMGYNFDQINPAWFDALRVTKLPVSKNQFGSNGNTYFSVRQTRFGVKGYMPTPLGMMTAVFDFDLFGVGVDEGQTTMRVRNAYGEIGRLLVGQANTPFMDGDVFPNTFEYWGPTGMVFFRNVQIRYAAMQGDNELFFALERPGASADAGSFAGRIELDSVSPQFPLPDFSAHFKKSGKWGHVQLASMLRYIKWQDLNNSGIYDLSGSVIGWGLHLSAVLNITKMDVFRGSFVYGEGVENYMNDAPVDVGIVSNPGNARTPIKGKALPVTGIVAFLDHNWTSTLSTSIGYSSTHISNTEFAKGTAYEDGQYAIVNLVTTPYRNFMAGVELEYGSRTNFDGSYKANDLKLQFSFKYNFSQIFYRDKTPADTFK
ncbi:MAG: DcaP family trimeric outer membrane transporter [Chitinophagales bacterium]